MRHYLQDAVVRSVSLVCALAVVAVISGIFAFLGAHALAAFGRGVHLLNFLFGTDWDPTGSAHANGKPAFGAGGLILGSLVVTLGAMLLATPLAVAVAFFLNEISPARLRRFFRLLIDVFTGVPSVVIGFFGLEIIVPLLQQLMGGVTGNHETAGFGWAAAILVLAVMVLPTTANISLDALESVPGQIRETSLALGSTRWQMITRALFPAALPGFSIAVILGMARAIGETMAVSLVLAGSRLPSLVQPPLNLFFQPNVNITQYIAIDFGESFGIGREAYFALAFVLLAISFLFVAVSHYLKSRQSYLAR